MWSMDVINSFRKMIEEENREEIINVQKQWARGFIFYKEVESRMWDMMERYANAVNDEFFTYLIETFTNRILSCDYTEWYKN